MDCTKHSWIPVLALNLACCQFARAQCQYEVTWFEPFDCAFWPDQQYSSLGINNLGGWAGYRLGCFPSETYLPVYCPAGEAPQTLSMPPGAGQWGAHATAVNDFGVVVGFFDTRSARTGCIWWPDGSVIAIDPVPGATNSTANAINNNDVVVGSGPYILDAGVMTRLPLPVGVAYAISDTKHVVGKFLQAEGKESAPIWRDRGFQWRNDEVTILEPIGDHSDSAALDVNNAGVVVGHSETYLGGQGYASLPTVWVDGKPMSLPLPAGYVRGGARGINDAGVIIGSVRTATSDGVIAQVVWINGQVHLISDLVIPGSPSVGTTDDLNDVGQIMTSGASLLTPVGQSLGDLNGDCAVNGSDLVVVLSEWGPREWSVADINTDGVVDGNDLAVVLGHWSS